MVLIYNVLDRWKNLSKLQIPNPNYWFSKDMEEGKNLVLDSIINEAICRAAPASPGLLARQEEEEKTINWRRRPWKLLMCSPRMLIIITMCVKFTR